MISGKEVGTPASTKNGDVPRLKKGQNSAADGFTRLVTAHTPGRTVSKMMDKLFATIFGAETTATN